MVFYILCFLCTSAKQLKELLWFTQENPDGLQIEAGFGEELRGDIQFILCDIILIWKR